jgi:hypothetical protein
MRLRQVALVARDLESVVEDLCAVLGIEVSFRDPGVELFGLRNAVMPIGDTFLEVVSPIGEDATAGRFLQRRGGDGGYMVMVQADDLDADCARIEALGVRVVWGIDLDDIRGRHLHPRDIGGAILSLDTPVPPSAWRWAGPDWPDRIRREVVSAIHAVELQAEDPLAMARRWAAVLGRSCTDDGGVGRIDLDEGSIRFVADGDGRGAGVGGFDVLCRDPEILRSNARRRNLELGDGCIEICGTRIYPVAAR